MTQLPATHQSSQPSTKLVVVALIVAVAALLLVNGYIELMRTQVHEEAFTVYRLTQSVEPGTELERDMLEEQIVPQRFEDAFRNAVSPTGLEGRLGAPVQRHALRHDVLTYDLFTHPDEHELDRRIGMGRRLVALPVNPRTIPGGLRPGMYVDIEAPFPGSQTRVMPVIENVQVLQVGEHSIVHEAEGRGGTGPRRFSTISIEVGPREATQLAQITRMVTQVGDFELHVRNPGDREQEKIPDGGINPEVLGLLE